MENVSPEPYDEGFDPELEQLEQSLDRGEVWKYPTKPDEEMDPGLPNPLVLRVTGVEYRPINGKSLPVLDGVDKAAKKWSRIIGTKSMQDVLLDGVISKWDDDRREYVEVARVGTVKAGERVSLLFKGFYKVKSGPRAGNENPDIRVVRHDIEANPAQAAGDDGIPF